jgi:acyl-CoA thioester hydrolase
VTTSRHQHEVGLRWSDFDALGHVNHAVVVTLLEEGRDAFLRDTLMESNPMYVVRKLEVDYQAEVTLEVRRANVECSVIRVGRTSLVMLERLVRPDGVVAAEAQSTCIWWDLESHSPRAFTEVDRARLSAEMPADNAPA